MQQTQESSQRYQIDACVPEFRKHGGAEILHVREIAWSEHDAFQTCVSGTFDAFTTFLAGNHQRDFRVQLSSANLIKKIQERCPPATD